MGTTSDQLDLICQLHRSGELPHPSKVADLGCQQLYGGSANDVRRFLAEFGITNVPETKLFELAKHGAFIGYTLMEAGFAYQSFDIVDAPFCSQFDLNTDLVSEQLAGTFDLVLNFGTTEHVLNQYNAFKALHDFTKPGGLIYSYFIRAGQMSHGLLHYSDRFVDLLCAANYYRQIWRSDHNVPGDECTWAVLKKTQNGPFQPIVDVQLGEGLPQLRQPQFRP